MLTSHETLLNQLLLNKISTLPEDTIILGVNLGLLLRQGKLPALLLLEGEMGAGKTYFAKGVGKAFGIEEEDILSPTFLIVREIPYENGVFYHCDFYRIMDSSQEVSLFGFFEEINENDLYLIEWPPQLEDSEILELKRVFKTILKVSLKIEEEGKRRIKIEKL